MAEHVVILTGASRGLGAALAEQLLGDHTRLICVARSKNDALEARAKLANAWLDYYLADLSEIDVTEELATNICEQLPSDAARYTLINNAGAIGPVDKSEVLNAREIAHTLQLNVLAAMTFTAQFLAVTKGFAGARRVVNISSGAGRRPIAGWATYCTSKAALDMATRCAALDEEGSANPARFVSLAPGVIDTDMQAAVRSADSAAFPDRQNFVDLKANNALATPQEAALKVLAYLQRADFGSNPIADVRDPV
jgi:sepiapterin reductase